MYSKATEASGKISCFEIKNLEMDYKYAGTLSAEESCRIRWRWSGVVFELYLVTVLGKRGLVGLER